MDSLVVSEQTIYYEFAICFLISLPTWLVLKDELVFLIQGDASCQPKLRSMWMI